MLLEVKNISKNFGGVRAVDQFSLEADKATITSIIGPNGAGKTTIFNVITGVYTADSGQVIMNGADVTRKPQFEITRQGIARTFQNIRLFKGLTVLENVLTAYDPTSPYGLFGGLFTSPARVRTERTGRELCESYLETVGMKEYRHERPENLSYGMQRRLEIARALACRPKVLLLDEPAAGLNPREVSDLTELIHDLKDRNGFAVILIEHRIELVMALSQKIYVQDFGKTIAIGTPTEIQADPEVIRAYLGEGDTCA